MKEEDFSDPIRIVAKKKIVVPNPIAPTDIIKNESRMLNHDQGLELIDSKAQK